MDARLIPSIRVSQARPSVPDRSDPELSDPGSAVLAARYSEQGPRNDEQSGLDEETGLSFAVRRVERTGLEPVTPCLQSRCSPS